MVYSSYGSNASPTLMGFALFNKDSTVDKTMLSFSMWKTTIKLAIYPIIESESEETRFDRKSGAAIYLTPMKAMQFAKLLQLFKQDPATYHGKGIPSGQSLITIEDPTNPKGFNRPGAGPCIVIRKINPETGIMESSYAYETRRDNGTIIDSYDDKTGKFTQSIAFPDIELDLIIMQLQNYTNAMTNTQAFTVVDALSNPLDKIATKLGIDLNADSRNERQYRNTNYFAKNQPSNSPQSYSSGFESNDDDLPF